MTGSMVHHSIDAMSASWLYCAFLLAILTTTTTTTTTVTAASTVRDLQIITPLQALTIPDGGLDAADLSRRQAFLERFQAGIKAEMKVLERKKNQYYGSTATTTTTTTSASGSAPGAAATTAALDFLSDREAERAFETATRIVASRQESRRKLQQSRQRQQQQYQFVGVIQPVVAAAAGDSSSASSSSTSAGGTGGESERTATIAWYARPKPKDARWSMRLVHVNREAVIKHLFDQGKVDIYGKYRTVVDAQTGERQVVAKYTASPRSWRNAWGTHPKRWFTESSGMFWRERRLREGLYTDGKNVYEATYRYQDGRNGMHLRSSLDEYLNSRSIDEAQKAKVQQQLVSAPPDVVLEL